MNITIETLPRTLIASSPRLPRRLEFYSEIAPAVLIGMDRGHELLEFTPPASLHLIVLSGRAAVSSPLNRIKLSRFDEFKITADMAWTIRALDSCDLLLIECDLPGAKKRDKIAEFLPSPNCRLERAPLARIVEPMARFETSLPTRAMAVMA